MRLIIAPIPVPAAAAPIAAPVPEVLATGFCVIGAFECDVPGGAISSSIDLSIIDPERLFRHHRISNNKSPRIRARPARPPTTPPTTGTLTLDPPPEVAAAAAAAVVVAADVLLVKDGVAELIALVPELLVLRLGEEDVDEEDEDLSEELALGELEKEEANPLEVENERPVEDVDETKVASVVGTFDEDEGAVMLVVLVGEAVVVGVVVVVLGVFD